MNDLQNKFEKDLMQRKQFWGATSKSAQISFEEWINIGGNKSRYESGDKLWTTGYNNGKYYPDLVEVKFLRGFFDASMVSASEDRKRDRENKVLEYKVGDGCSYYRVEYQLYENIKDCKLMCQKLNDQINRQINLKKDMENILGDTDSNKDRFIEDGIYNLSELEYLRVNKYNLTEEYVNNIKIWTEKYPDYMIASAYETNTIILISSMPERFTGIQIGSGFNHGSTNLIENCPKRLLILVEND